MHDSRFNNRLLALGLCLFTATWGDIPTGVTLEPAFETSTTNRLRNPIVLLEIPGKQGHFIATEQGNYGADSGYAWVLAKNETTWKKSKFVGIPVRRGSSEMGFLGMAFHPKYAENRKYYVNYNSNGSGDSTYVEERVADATLLKDSGVPPKRLLAIPQPANNHNGGTLNFGPDGYLYIGMGDGGGSGITQQKTEYYGAILRINVDQASEGRPYTIPADNPFTSDIDPNTKKEIWAYGFRNPWKWNFDPANGDLWVGDVGSSTYEEITIVRKGENHGWKIWEGLRCVPGNCSEDGYVKPVVALKRDSATCIVGGVVYRGHPSSQFNGVYIFGDHETRYIYAMNQKDRVRNELVRIATAPSSISAFGTDSDGNVYVLGHDNGIIYRLIHAEFRSIPTRLANPLNRRGEFRLLNRKGPSSSSNEDLIGSGAEIFSIQGGRIVPRSGQAGAETVRLQPGLHLYRHPKGTGRLLILD